MYSLDQIRKGVRWSLESPSLLFRELNHIYYAKRFGADYNRRGVDVIDEDWDTLVILDACRYELFSEENPIEGRLEKRISRGAHTSGFLRGNFDGRTLHNTVYTTASPQLQKRRDEIDVEFHAVNNVWDSERWDEEERTVLPDSMTDAGLEAHERYPDKRHIVHYIQPHYPFIGYDLDEGIRTVGEDGFDIWEQRIRGRIDVSPEEIWSAYRNNLRLAFDAVERLIENVDGQIVVTSDHGNMIGERSAPIPIREWGHPPGMYTNELVTVPWLVLEGESRRKIRSDPPAEAADAVDDDVIEERLGALGYK